MIWFGSVQIDFTLSKGSFSLFAFLMRILCLFSKSAQGCWSVCEHVVFLWALLLTSADGGGSGVWATEQTVFGCVRGPQDKRCLWLGFGCAGLLAVWVQGLLENMMCPTDSSLSICKALTRSGNKSSFHMVCIGHRGSHGLSPTHTLAHKFPAATMCEACFTSLPHPCVKVMACSLSIVSVKTWEQWIVSCLHQWTHSVRVLTEGYELLSTERIAQLDLTQNTHFGSWPIHTPT